MSYEVRISDLGIAGDDTTFHGETPEEVADQVVEHLRSQHRMKLPDAEFILNGENEPVVTMAVNTATGTGGTVGMFGMAPPPGEQPSSAAAVVVKRLREALKVQTSHETT
jgi:predicted small metal-binding protein